MKQVLIIDGEEADLTLVRTALEGICAVTAARSGPEALSYLQHDRYDMVLLVVDGPALDGMKTMMKATDTEKNCDVPFVVLSSDGSDETECLFLGGGAKEYLAKSLSPNLLRARVNRILKSEEQYHRLSEQLRETIREVKDIRSVAQRDALTGLWNRSYTEEKINALCADGVRGALFMIDMDNFKRINDRYGHIAGDEVLRGFADTMRAFSTEGDILCRIGGDEFVLYYNRTTTRRDLSKLAANMIEDLCRKLQEKGYDSDTAVSIGIALLPEDGASFTGGYSAADKALYYVKQNGKSSYRFYNERRKRSTREETLADLRYLREAMARSDETEGAYILDSVHFRHVYNFIQRFVNRADCQVQTVLFTARDADEKAEPKEIEQALEDLTEAIHKSLRRSDISTRYSSKQVIAVLMDSNTESSTMVVRRILNCYESITTTTRITIEYDIASNRNK